MSRVGIEALNVYAGEAYLEVADLFEARGLDTTRMDNLMMQRKSVALPSEDAVSCAVNAAKPIVDRLGEEQRAGIELLIVGTESGVDFGKAVATYVHDLLGLPRSCRVLEVKQACYAGVAGLQLAAATVRASPFDRTRALVIAADVPRPLPDTYVEPSQGAGAVAALVGGEPAVAELDWGANGFHSFEVMDTCRPTPEMEAGDADLSLLTFIECLQGAYTDYARKVEGAGLRDSFDFLAMHTPFPGMVKGAHRTVLRRLEQLSAAELEADFERRVAPAIRYPQLVGNLYSATALLAIASTIDNAPITRPSRLGVFSYGSGCSSEFFSCVISPESTRELAAAGIGEALDARYRLSAAEYDELLAMTGQLRHGSRDHRIDLTGFEHITGKQLADRRSLMLVAIRDYHREYEWVGGGTP